METKKTNAPITVRRGTYEELIKELSSFQSGAGKIVSISDFIDELIINWRKTSK